MNKHVLRSLEYDFDVFMMMSVCVCVCVCMYVWMDGWMDGWMDVGGAITQILLNKKI